MSPIQEDQIKVDMQLRNGKCYISEVEAWWNTYKAKNSNVQTIMMAVAMKWISQKTLRQMMTASYAQHWYETKKAAIMSDFQKKLGEICDDTDDTDDEDDEEEDAFECPNCSCVLKGDAANDERVWIATKCDCGDGDENCANCGYDVCMECEDECQEREEADGNAREDD